MSCTRCTRFWRTPRPRSRWRENRAHIRRARPQGRAYGTPLRLRCDHVRISRRPDLQVGRARKRAVVSMLRVGLNPYGLAYSIGLQGRGTARANAAPMTMAEFIALAARCGASCVELDGRWLANLGDADLAETRDSIAATGMTPLCSDWLLHEPGETLDHALRYTAALGARLLRLHLTPVLEGARARHKTRWQTLLDHARAVLNDAAPKAAARGLVLAIENHQDLTSEELLAFADEA